MRQKKILFLSALLLMMVNFALFANESEPVIGESGDESAKRFINHCDTLDNDLREAVLTVVQQHPEVLQWSGVCDDRIFSIIAIKVPEGKVPSRIRQAIRSECGIRIIAELLTAKSLMEFYQSERLDDITTLKTAAISIGSELQSSGKLTLDFKKVNVEGQFIVGLAVARKEKVIAVLSEPAQKELVKESYRNVMHHQARLMMKNKQWKDALGFWRHLHERQLVSARLYLDAAVCFDQLKMRADAAAVAREALVKYAELNESDYYERLGDILLLDTENEESRKAAEIAFQYADERFVGNSTIKHRHTN